MVAKFVEVEVVEADALLVLAEEVPPHWYYGIDGVVRVVLRDVGNASSVEYQ